MTGDLRVALEIGPKGKKVVGWALDWPGLERGARDPETALDKLATYRSRYLPVAARAGMAEAFSAEGPTTVVESYEGVGSTDFWGISFAFSDFDRQPMSAEELERELTLMQACWAFFDEVRARVSPELRKGPRGGGRDRDQVVRHTIVPEQYDWSRKLGLPSPATDLWSSDEALRARRNDYCDAIRGYHVEGKMAKKWPLRYLIRHTAFHTLDHAWEMEDRDLGSA